MRFWEGAPPGGCEHVQPQRGWPAQSRDRSGLLSSALGPVRPDDWWRLHQHTKLIIAVMLLGMHQVWRFPGRLHNTE